MNKVSNVWNSFSDIERLGENVPQNYVLRIDPNGWMPEEIKEELQKFMNFDRLFYTEHAEERLKERDLACFKSLRVGEMDYKDINHSNSRHKNHTNSVLSSSFNCSIQKLEITYNPKNSQYEILRATFRMTDVLKDKETLNNKSIADNKPGDGTDMIVVLSTNKRDNPNKKVGVVVTGWSASNDDYNLELGTSFANKKECENVKSQIEKDYKKHCLAKKGLALVEEEKYTKTYKNNQEKRPNPKKRNGPKKREAYHRKGKSNTSFDY